MTDFATPDAPSVAGRQEAADSRLPVGLVLALALLCAAALSFSRAEAVWRTGAFFDSDDAMRAVQLRDFLAGQPWFDLTAYRLDPPGGLPMHWSRIVDVSLAGLDLLFSRFLAPEYAERATRLVFPFLLLAALFAVVGWLAAILSGPRARSLAVWLAMLSGATFLQFTPGRIDHHAPQIVTLAASLCFFLQGLDANRASRLAASAALMALSFAISLENLPFFAVMMAALPLFFVFEGASARGRLLWFAGGALVAFPSFYAATVPSARYFASVCDAFSFAHIAALCIGALSLVALALAAPWLPTFPARLLAAGGAGLATLSSVLLLAPHCIGDPLVGLDPLIRDLWLSHVAEAKPLLALFPKAPGIVVATAAPVALGLAAATVFAWRVQGLARRRWLLTAAVVATGLAAGLWQLRVFSSVTPLAMAPLAAAIVALVERPRVGVALRAPLAGFLAILVSPIGLALALPSGDDNEADGERACLTPQALAPLAEMAPTRVLGSFDLGSHILAHTPHSVFAAPYHRDNHGNLFAARAFMAAPDEAEAMLRKAGVGLVVWCARAKALSPLVSAAPDGLAAMLARGESPAWLERKSQKDAPLLVFALRAVK
ncbi:hypothetical protein [Methylocystis sp. Sn-Cys]|uniref:hypothetical protein n=1 Tax=Methylocystis sp. Sn-Cys TaxID=1701263 RepID=UPI001921D7AD|nr:hypothetical protein [Methylocystis sp. Sn-Cys]MBL1255552.1 hypothetical protein [Methylocystis sp. Sn-Cys]